MRAGRLRGLAGSESSPARAAPRGAGAGTRVFTFVLGFASAPTHPIFLGRSARRRSTRGACARLPVGRKRGRLAEALDERHEVVEASVARRPAITSFATAVPRLALAESPHEYRLLGGAAAHRRGFTLPSGSGRVLLELIGEVEGAGASPGALAAARGSARLIAVPSPLLRVAPPSPRFVAARTGSTSSARASRTTRQPLEAWTVSLAARTFLEDEIREARRLHHAAGRSGAPGARGDRAQDRGAQRAGRRGRRARGRRRPGVLPANCRVRTFRASTKAGRGTRFEAALARELVGSAAASCSPTCARSTRCSRRRSCARFESRSSSGSRTGRRAGCCGLRSASRPR